MAKDSPPANPGGKHDDKSQHDGNKGGKGPFVDPNKGGGGRHGGGGKK